MVGVPEIVPFELSPTPGGSVPLTTLQVNVPIDASVCSDRVYAAPGCAETSAVVVIVSGTATLGVVIPAATSSVLTDWAAAAGVTAPDAS